MNTDPLQLERHTAFAARLARSLVADENAADDLVQDTWLAVLRRPPRDPVRIRAFLATSLRRAAGRLRRSDSRRARREREAARGEPLPSSESLAIAMEEHQRVVQALLELNEATRSALLLRYFDDLAPREIARRSGEPVETIRTRIKRGLATLRARLDEREGGRRAWAATLAPLFRSTPIAPVAPLAGGASTIPGALVMTTQAKLALGALFVIAAGLAWRAAVTRRAEPALASRPPSDQAAAKETEAAAGIDPPRHDAVAEAQRAPVESAEDPAEPAAPAVARWPRPSVLRVVDARTGADLEGVTLLRGVGHSRNQLNPGPWGDEAEFARDATSPIELDSANEAESWWAWAPGHVWGWLRVDHRTGGERVIPLEPGGADLEVRLEGFDPDLDLWVHLFPPGYQQSFGSLVALRWPAADRLTFVGLPAGEVQVRAELGIWHDGPRELAREEIELLPGVQNEVVLDLEEHGAPPPAVPLAGRIVFPASRPDLEVKFEILPQGGAAWRKGDRLYSGRMQLERVPDQPRVRRFDAGLVTPGRYLFASSSLQYWEAFEVGPRGAPDVEIALPEVGEVHVRVVDRETGERLTVERITWSAGWPEGLSSWTLASVDADPASGEYVFVAPLRRISVSVRWDEYADAARALDVVAGAQEVELRVQRLPGAWIRLVDGEATVPVEWGWTVVVAPVDGEVPDPDEAEARITRIEGGRAWIAAARPGTYVVTLPEITGFEPVPPRILELGPGAPEELVVELRRR